MLTRGGAFPQGIGSAINLFFGNLDRLKNLDIGAYDALHESSVSAVARLQSNTHGM